MQAQIHVGERRCMKRWKVIFSTANFGVFMFFLLGLFNQALADEAPDYLELTCLSNSYTLYPESRDARVCEMFQGVVSCENGFITFWDENYITWVTGSDTVPVVSVYSLNRSTQVYHGNTASRRVTRTGLDLRHQNVDLLENTGPSVEPMFYSMPCDVEEGYWPSLDLRPEAIIGRD